MAQQEKTDKPKTQLINDTVSQIQKAHGQGAIMRFGEAATEAMAVVPTASLALDEALGIGGYPRGRVVEVFGPESSGKTTLALHAIAQVQAEGGIAAFIDAEHAFDLRYAKAVGIDLTKLLVSQPDCGEQALDITEMLTRSGSLQLIVIDSVAALVPKAELEGDMGDSHMGLQARLMAQALRKLNPTAEKTGTTLFFINQLRQKIGVVFGSPETTPGGQALRFFSSVRLDVRRIGKVTLGETVVGNRTRVKVVKNKCASPFKEAEFDIRWGIGIDRGADLIETALGCGVLDKNGAHITFGGKSIGQGRDKAREAVQSDAQLHTAVLKATLDALPSYQARRGNRRAA
jgi:recombination protein RecA